MDSNQSLVIYYTALKIWKLEQINFLLQREVIYYFTLLM